MASTSEVWREITRPDVYRSWNERLSPWKWVNTRRRMSSSTSWPTRPESSRKPLNDSAPIVATTKKMATMIASGRTLPLPPSSSGGMPLSIPSMTSRGAASTHAVLTAMSADASARRRRCGRINDAMSARLRVRNRPARPGLGSSTSSAATPRHASTCASPVRSSGPSASTSGISSGSWMVTPLPLPPRLRRRPG